MEQKKNLSDLYSCEVSLYITILKSLRHHLSLKKDCLKELSSKQSDERKDYFATKSCVRANLVNG